MPTNGTFIANEVTGILALRGATLDSEVRHPNLEVLNNQLRVTSLPYEMAEQLRLKPGSKDIGFALTAPNLPEEVLLTTARLLGAVMQETDPETQPFVRHGSILNLRTIFSEAVDPAMQPFSTKSIALHTEGSRASGSLRPHSLLFHCVQAVDASEGGMTIVVYTDDVVSRLSQESRVVLGTTRFGSHSSDDAILTRPNGLWTLSFRDFCDDPMEWQNDGNAHPTAVNSALGRLLVAMYRARTYALGMKSGTLVHFANARMVHGRTAFADLSSRRFLRRVCLRNSRP